MRAHAPAAQAQRGFSMVEVLVAVVVFAFGVLALVLAWLATAQALSISSPVNVG